MDDPTKLGDSDLIIAMGTHNDNCDCAHCREWERRREAKRNEAPAEALGACTCHAPADAEPEDHDGMASPPADFGAWLESIRVRLAGDASEVPDA